MAAAAISGAVEVIGLVSSVIGIVQFGQGMTPSKCSNAPDCSTIRIGLGTNSANLSNSGGDIGAIKVYNDLQVLIGAGSGDGYIGEGSFQDITINQAYGPGKQPTYVQINALDDAVCIAYITQTWPDGKERGWLGDMGRVCGYDWGYSNVIVNDDNYKPYCTWIDQNHDNIRTAGLQIHMTEFSTDANSTDDFVKDAAHYCAWPTMLFSPNTDRQGMADNALWPAPASVAATSKRSYPPTKSGTETKTIRKRSEAMKRTIIGSQHAEHSALELCASETSHSPDFVSFYEGVFCDMGTKTAWPLCSESLSVECYRWETHSLVGAGGDTKKQYEVVQTWE